MTFRTATPADLPGIFTVRLAVRENRLSDPGKITHELCRQMMMERGRGWVCDCEGQITGFAIVDLLENNIWALFVFPGFEGKGIGRQLHQLMLEWAFSQAGVEQLWLTTDRGTRAEGFYRKMGWTATGVNELGEVRFEMNKSHFLNFTPQ